MELIQFWGLMIGVIFVVTAIVAGVLVGSEAVEYIRRWWL